MRSVLLSLVLFHTVAVLTSAQNDFISKSLGSNMVLQRNTKSSLYGYSSTPNATISVEFNTEVYNDSASRLASTGGGYFWKVYLNEMPGGFTAYTIKVTSSAGESATLDNILFGDVYLCSGQSNMQFAMDGMFDRVKEIENAEWYPNIRVFSLGQADLPQTTDPLDELVSVSQPWSVGSSDSVNSFDVWGYFSAVCWEFGTNVYWGALGGKIPVGLVSTNWGGTPIEAWVPVDVITACSDSDPESGSFNGRSKGKSPPGSGGHTPASPAAHPPIFHPEYPWTAPRTIPTDTAAMSTSGASAMDPNSPAALYNTMVAPLQHMAVTGTLWYQGESNVGSAIYGCLQEGLLKTWRELFGNEMAFLYTQLSTWSAGGMGFVPAFRKDQEDALNLPAHQHRAGMISAADIGDPDSPYGDIHPRNKTEVGRRLALAAATVVYGIPAVPHMGPVITSVVSLAGGGVRVTFSPESCGEGGVHLEPVQTCPDTSVAQIGGCGKVSLQYSPGVQREAAVVVSGVFAVDLVPTAPVAVGVVAKEVSYGEGDYPLLSIYNSFGVPLLPFAVQVTTV